MSALVVCGKRSSSSFFFDEDQQQILQPSSSSSSSSSSSPSSNPASKRARCGGFGFPSSPPFLPQSNLFAQLMALFPEMDPKILERALDASGNDLDSAIRSLNELRLESTSKSENGIQPTNNVHLANEGAEGLTSNGIVGPTGDDQSGSGNSIPKDGSEWVELFVREMMNASDMDDARARASRALEVFEKSVLAQAVDTAHKENMMLKGQLEALLRENAILKRAVAIQHERQKEYDETNHELQNLKQLVAQYQEQVRTLEINNYALTMHLRQAQQGGSIPGRFHPDVF